MTRATAAEIAAMVASDFETNVAAEAAGAGFAEVLTLIFSMKESLYKALYPVTRRAFEARDCTLETIDPATKRFVLRLAQPFAAGFGDRFAGAWDLADGAARAGVLLPSHVAG